jgi:hypothetical protein
VSRWAAAAHRISTRRACGLCSISSGCYRYASRRQPDDEVIQVLTRLAESKPRWGFGLMFDWLRMRGHDWNHKRVYRVYKELELNLRIKPKRRFPSRNTVPLDEARQPNDCWSLDFMSDIASAKRQGLDPFVYLREVLAMIGSTPINQLDQFQPDVWKQKQLEEIATG